MIRTLDESALELSYLPFSGPEREVVFIGSQAGNRVRDFVERNIMKLNRIFADEGLKFSYIPDAAAENASACICSGEGERSGNGFTFKAFHISADKAFDDKELMFQFQQISWAFSRKKAVAYEESLEDTETAAMLYEMEKLARALRLKGVRSDLFDRMLSSLEQPVGLTVNEQGHIILPTLGNQNVRLNPVEKTLFFYFLQHPEGVLADALVGDRKQLLKIYNEVSVFGDMGYSETVIDSLLSEDKKALYTNISRLKSKFVRQLGERLAEHYIIRQENGRYLISLPRTLVTWESEAFRF